MVSITIEFKGQMKKIAGMDNLAIDIPDSECEKPDFLFSAIKNVLGDKMLYSIHKNGKAITAETFTIAADDCFQIVPVILGG